MYLENIEKKIHLTYVITLLTISFLFLTLTIVNNPSFFYYLSTDHPSLILPNGCLIDIHQLKNAQTPQNVSAVPYETYRYERTRDWNVVKDVIFACRIVSRSAEWGASKHIHSARYVPLTRENTPGTQRFGQRMTISQLAYYSLHFRSEIRPLSSDVKSHTRGLSNGVARVCRVKKEIVLYLLFLLIIVLVYYSNEGTTAWTIIFKN